MLAIGTVTYPGTFLRVGDVTSISLTLPATDGDLAGKGRAVAQRTIDVPGAS
jgi:hypothetical protein